MKKIVCCLVLLALLAFFMLSIKAEEPAQNAFVILDWTDGKHSLSNITIADTTGYYEIKVAEGTVNITAVFGDLYLNKTIVVFNSTGNFSITGVKWRNITLPSFPEFTATIKGYIFDNITGLPIQNANISILFTDDYFGGVNFTYSNATGYYEFHLPPSNVSITVEAEGYYTSFNATYVEDMEIINFSLDPLPTVPPVTAVIKGYVNNSDTKAAIENANVTINGLNFSYYDFTLTDASGYYELNVPPGNFSMIVDADGYLSLHIYSFEVNDSEVKWINISLPPFPPNEVWIEGHVYDNETGKPIPNANVNISGTVMKIPLYYKVYERNTVTNETGYYNVSVPASYLYQPSYIFEFYVEVDGYFTNSISISDSLTPGTTIHKDVLLDPIPPENCIVKGYIYIMIPKRIHYVGGAGAGNYTSIQDAINAASDGDIIKVYPGTYDGPIVINKEIKLIGDPVIDGHGGYGIEIEANNTLVENFTVFNCSYGIYAQNLSFTLHNITIKNCTVYDCANYGIFVHHANDVFVENNTIYNVSIAGIVIWDVNGGDIKNNEMFDSGNALPISGCSNLVISGNKIHDNSGDGIKITGNSIHNEITSNHIYNNSGYYSGVFIDKSYYNEITSNYIYNNTKYGIYINSRNNTISYNSLYENGFCAIYIAESNNSILSNSIYNNSGNGIEIYSSNNVINYNLVSNNDDNGIVIRDTASNVSITGNKIDNNRLCAIYLIGNNNTVQSNTLWNNSAYGIYLMGDNNTVSSNNIVSCNYGIYVKETARENEIKDNIIKGSATSELYIYGQHNTFINNTINSTKFSFTYEGNLSIKNASLPASPPSHWQHIGKFLEISKLDGNPAWMDIRIYYDDSDVAGLNESSLKIWRYSYGWQEDGWNGSRYLDMINNIVGVNITSFSIFAPLAMIPNHLPYATNPTPANGSTDVSTNPTLSVVVHDEDGDTMNVSFYDASSDTLIGYVDGVSSGNTVSIVWSGLDYGTTYYWYVIVNDGFDSNKSDVWHFTTTLPKPTVVYVDDDYDSSTSGWGYDHFANITDGINGVASGGIVYVYEGVYEESLGINKEVSIVAQGNPANTIIKASGQNAVTMNYPCLLDGFTIRDAHADYDNVRGIWVKADGCIIRNVTITNISARQNESKVIYTYGIMINYADNCTIENVTIYDIEGNDSTAYGMYVYESSNNSFKDITIFNITSVSTAYGVYISYSKDSKLVGINISNVDGSSSYGIRIGYADNNILRWINVTESKYGILLDYYSDYNIIENCIVVNNTLYGIIIGRATHNVVRNNSVYDNSYGITLWTGCYNNTIENNTIFSNDYYGIYFYSEDTFNIIKENVIYNNQYGIYLNELAGNNTIFSNYIYNNAVEGMRIYSSYNNISSNHVSNNSKYGILISSGESNTVYTNYIHDNGWDGIRISSYSSNNTIISNYIYNNSYDGIKLYYYTDGNIIKNNYIYNNSDGIEISYKNHTNNVIQGNYIYSNRYNGIFFDAIAINNTIMDNEIYDNGNNGIYIKSGGEFNSILNCDIYSNGYYGIRLENSINNTVSGCTIYSNGDDGILIYSNSNNNSIFNCNIYSNDDFGIWISTSSNYNNISGCNIYSNNNAGVGMGYSSIHNVIHGCNIYDNEDGVYISSSNNVVSGCNISSNNYRGINIQASSNEIKSNYITGNQYGIYIGSVNNNLIYNNYFNNTINAYDEGNNIWNISKISGKNILGGAWLGGNYWHDYAGNDTDGDDLGDTMLPYNAGGNIINGGDWHPLLVPTNHPPAVPYNPTPSDGATDVELDITLQWQCYDPDGDALSYDVYFGSLPSSLEKKEGNITSASYSISNLQYSTTYYWRIVAWDEYGAKSKGPIWNFTTKANSPPSKPSLSGPASGYTGMTYTFSALATDPDGDKIKYGWDWNNDGNVDEWSNYYDSGKTVYASHSWALPGTYYIKVMAQDEYGATSEWSEVHQITITEYIPPPQNTPPNIEITSPSDESIISGVVTIQGKAWDVDGNETIQKVEIRIDGGSWIIASGTTSWSYSWDTTKVANGLHKIEARCYDGQDYSNIVSINVTVNNIVNTPPVVSIDYPSNGSTVSGEIIIKGKAWDEDGNESIVKVEIRIDGGEWQNATGILNWAYKLDTKKLKNGVHTIEIRAYDGINYSNIIKINIDVQNKEKKGIPGFELVIIIAAIAAVLIRRKIEKSI